MSANSTDPTPQTPTSVEHTDNAARRAAFKAGVIECLQVTPSYIPFGLVCGVSAVQAGLGEWGAIGLAAFSFAGSAQAVLTQFLSSEAPLFIAVLSGLMVNLRMAVYSAAIAPRLLNTTRNERVLWAFFLVDQTFISNEARRQRNEHEGYAFAFFMGCALVLWPWWVLMNGIGAFVGAQLPVNWQLEFTIPLSFIAMVVPILKNRAKVIAALTGAAAGVVLYALPFKLGLIAACVIGTGVGMVVDAWIQRR